MAVLTRRAQSIAAPIRIEWQWGVPLIAALAAVALGLAIGLGTPQNMLLAGIVIPFGLVVTLARPHWAVSVYAVLVYANLLSILVEYEGLPPLARFVGFALFAAVLGYRLIIRREGLVHDGLTWWLVAYGVVVALGLLYARSTDLVATNVIEFVRNFLTYLIVLNVITTAGRLRTTVWLLLGMGVVLASLTVYQSVTGQFDNLFGGLAQSRVSEIAGGSDAPRAGGTIGDANFYGQMLLIVVPFGLYLLWEGGNRLVRLAGLAASALLIAAALLTYSRGDMVALVVLLGAAIFYKRPGPRVLAGGAVALVVLIAFLPSGFWARMVTIVDVATGDKQTLYNEASIRGRAGATEAAIQMFLDHPLLGVGRENYPLYELQYLAGNSLARSSKGIPPHNLYLEVASEHGIVGIVVVGGLLLLTWRALFEARRRFLAVNNRAQAELASWMAIGFLSYLVSALFLHGAYIYMLWLQVALIVALRQIARAESHEALAPALPAIGVRSDEPPPRPQPAAEPDAETAPAVSAAEAIHRLWLGAAEEAQQRGDLMTARALADAILERDPYNRVAQQLLLRLRLEASLVPARTARVAPTRQPARAPSRVDARPAAPPAERYQVSPIFRDFWRSYGGGMAFGLPVSPIFVEANRQGDAVQVQYFERARLEYHPARGVGERQVLLGDLGAEAPVRGRLASPLPEGLRGSKSAVIPGGVRTPWKFFIYWHLNGGAALFGNPLTPVLADIAPNGEPVYVQYFERARMEYHPEHANTVREVQLTNLGAEILKARYPATN